MKIFIPLFITSIVLGGFIANASPRQTLTEDLSLHWSTDSTIITGLHIRNHTDFDVEELIRWFCEKHGIKDAFIRVSYLEGREVPFLGIITYQGPNIYFIRILKNLWRPGKVLMHELVHVRQYYSGELTSISHSKVMYMYKHIDLHKSDLFS